jgi:hypothetical protein
MSWPGQQDQNWGRQGGYGGGNPYQMPGQAPGTPGGFGGPPPPPPAGGGGGALAVFLVVLAVVVLVGGVSGVLLLSTERPQHNPLPPTTASAPTPPEPSAPAPRSPAPAGATIKPRIAGWQGVAARHHGLAYDVPRAWEVLTPTTIVGFEDEKGNPLVGMSGAAGVEQGGCTRLRTGVAGGKAPDTSRSARLSDLPGTAQSMARRWADAGYTPKNGPAPTIRLSRPTGIRLGRIRGYHVIAQVTVNGRRGTCDPPRAVVHAVAFPSTQGDPVVFIAYADLGITGALGDTDIRKAISSIRPLG